MKCKWGKREKKVKIIKFFKQRELQAFKSQMACKELDHQC
jgi:hypothetical protein